jgi:hypothetical protein
MNTLLKKLGIDETFTKAPKLPKVFTKVKDQIPHKADYNFMADLLMLPETKNKNKYLLTIDDLATDEIDFEPMKTKEPKEVLASMKNIFKRKYLSKPYASITTDGGAEFKGVFAKWLYDESIYHKVTEPDRHKQLANIENLNKQIGRLLNGYMNMKEKETKKVFKEWDEPKILNMIREEMNKSRQKPEKDVYTEVYPILSTDLNPKYKVGDIVYKISEVPRSALGNVQPTKNFRVGDYRWDMVPRKVVKILPYTGKVPIRYVLDFMPHVSYAEYELKPATEQAEKFVVKKLIDKKVEKKKTFYKVWWKGYKKAEATWEPAEIIQQDAPQAITEYEGDK